MLWRVLILMLVAAGAFGETKEAVSRTLALWDKSGEHWRVCARRHETAQAEVAKRLAPILESIEGALAPPVDALGMGYGVLADQAVGLRRGLLTGVAAQRFANRRLPDEHGGACNGGPSLSSRRFAATAVSMGALALYLPERLAAAASARMGRARQWLATENREITGRGPESAQRVTGQRSAFLLF